MPIKVVRKDPPPAPLPPPTFNVEGLGRQELETLSALVKFARRHYAYGTQTSEPIARRLDAVLTAAVSPESKDA